MAAIEQRILLAYDEWSGRGRAMLRLRSGMGKGGPDDMELLLQIIRSFPLFPQVKGNLHEGRTV